MKFKRKIDQNWETVLQEYSILDKVETTGYAELTSQQIRKLGIEPRLLSKIDSSRDLPIQFRDRNISILSISNSIYGIGYFKLYEKLPIPDFSKEKLVSVPRPTTYESLSFSNITSESQAIATANLTGMFSIFLGEAVEQTVSGKSRAPKFSFTIKNLHGGIYNLTVDRAQIEVDAGFEGEESFYITEAKNSILSDFNLRQLYYPYRTWVDKVKKNVIPIYLTQSGNVFNFYKYEFKNKNDCSSIELIKRESFILIEEKLLREEVINLALASLKRKKFNQSEISYPQANDFIKIIQIAELLAEGARVNPLEIADMFAMSQRQGNYYAKAVLYLDLAKETLEFDGTKVLVTSDKALSIFRLPYKQKYLRLIEIVFEVEGMALLFLKLDQYSKLDTSEAIKHLDIKDKLRNKSYSPDVVRRRAETMIAWLKWVSKLLD